MWKPSNVLSNFDNTHCSTGKYVLFIALVQSVLISVIEITALDFLKLFIY